MRLASRTLSRRVLVRLAGLVAVLAAALAVASAASGQNGGWFENHYYQVVETPLGWHEAVDYCAASEDFPSLGGHLVTINSAAENSFVYSLNPNHSWLGATDEVSEGTWQWVSGEPFAYTNWAPGEPNNLNNEDYLKFWGVDDFGPNPDEWNDVGGGALAFVCEYELPLNLFTEPGGFAAAVAGFGASSVVDFNDFDAGPVNNSINGRDPFPGDYYSDRGFTFGNPNADPLYVAPGGLFWNESNSLSVARFPFEADEPPISYANHDDLSVVLDPSCAAVGFTLIDNGSARPTEYVEFLDASGSLIARMPLPLDYVSFRAFIGIVSPDLHVAAMNVVEDANDGDDVAYDDFVCYSGTIQVGIDIKPGSNTNPINLKSDGVIPVAILTTEEFDATTVDPLTVVFGPGETTEAHGRGHLEDVDGDGDIDLMLHFSTQASGIQAGDSEACLTGATFAGQAVAGCDRVTVK